MSEQISDIPPLDINKLIQLIYDIATAEGETDKKEAVKEFARPYQEFAVVFAKDKAIELIVSGVGTMGITALANEEFADQVVELSSKIALAVKDYMNGTISDEQLLSKVGGSGVKDMTMQVLSALGIHEKLGVKNAEAIFTLSPAAVAFTASIAAFKELKKAYEDLDAAQVQRAQIEMACRESISMIRKYRQEMERIVSTYLTEKLETFESGFTAMDQAMLDGDADGYIKGSVEIQEILGYGVHFRNQDEFDDLMNSDEAFKL